MTSTTNPGRVKNVLTDLQIVVERHSEVLVANEKLPFQILLVVATIGRLLSLSHTLFAFFSLTANQLYSVELWRLLTSPFVGRNFLEFALTLACLHFGCTLLHQNNTNYQLLRVFGIAQLITPVCICVVAFLAYVIFGHIGLLYQQPLAGMLPIDMTVMVLVKQFLPDSIVLTTPAGRLKYTHLPMTLLFLTTLTSLFTLSHWVQTLEAMISMQISWTYLRFMQPHPTDAVYGDSSEHFTWASLFPSRARPFCSLLGTACYRGLVKLGLIRRTVRTVDINQLQSVAIGSSSLLPNLEDPVRDAERRRKLALEALNERLAKIREPDQHEWPSDEDDDVTTGTGHGNDEEVTTRSTQSEKATSDA